MRELKKITAKLFIFSIIGVFVFCNIVYAKNIAVELQLDREYVEIGDIITLGIVIKDTQNIPAPKLPEIEGFKIQYLGPATQMSIINGRSSSSVTHRYRLVAIKTGVFNLGPFSFSYKSDSYTTTEKKIEVVDRGQGASKQVPLTKAANDTQAQAIDGKIFLDTALEKNSAYVNEKIPLAVRLYVSNLAVRDIQYPVLDGQGFIKEDFQSHRKYKEKISGADYEVVEFKTWLYPTKSGQVTIGPAKIKCNIVARSPRRQRRGAFDSFFDDSFFSDFFTQLQVFPQEVTSEQVLFQVKDFPKENKPNDFSGAVGDFKMKIQAAPLKLKAGDPITLEIEIAGSGNLDSVQAPQFKEDKQFKVYAAQSTQENTSKSFEQVIIPLSEAVSEIPEIEFSFFNPKANKYITVSQPPIPLVVEKPLESSIKIVEGRKKRCG